MALGASDEAKSALAAIATGAGTLPFPGGFWVGFGGAPRPLLGRAYGLKR